MTDAPGEQLARTVRTWRDAKGWSQDDLAARAEVSRSAVQSIERASHKPRQSILGRVARALGTEPAVLLRGDPPPMLRATSEDARTDTIEERLWRVAISELSDEELEKELRRRRAEGE